MPENAAVEIPAEGLTSGVSLPPVDARAVAAGEAPPSPAPAPAQADLPRDEKGRPFDPAIHVTKNGKPVFRTEGGKTLKYLKCKRGNAGKFAKVSTVAEPPPAAPEAAQGQSSIGTAPEAAPANAAVVDESAAAAAMLAGTMISLAQVAMGPSWAAEEGEGEALAGSWKRVLDHYGVKEFGPWMSLAIVTGGYAAKRIIKPDHHTASRLERFKVWSYGRWLWFKEWAFKIPRQKPKAETPEATTAKAA